MFLLASQFDPWLTRVSSSGVAIPFALATGALGLVGVVFMMREFLPGSERRKSGVEVFVIGLGYALVNAAGLFMTAVSDAYALFEPAYLLTVTCIAPGLILTLQALLTLFGRGPSGRGVLGFFLWIVSVSLAHFFVVAMLQRGV